MNYKEAPHINPADCVTWYDGCHCTVENLQHNIERADKAEAQIKQLLEVLKSVEWVGGWTDDECPSCKGFYFLGHKEGCKLFAAIDSGEMKKLDS